MSESKFNQRFRQCMKSCGIFTFRVESHSTCPGIPDNHWINMAGLSGWLEMKQEKTLPKKIEYRPNQPGWLMAYSMCGGRCGTAVHIESTDTLLLICGKDSYKASMDLGRVERVRVVELRKGKEAWREVANWLEGFEPIQVTERRP